MRIFPRHMIGTLFLCAGLGACSHTLHEASSGPTGCTPNEIDIINESSGLLTRTWIAVCRSKAYQCSAATRQADFPLLWDVQGAACSRRPEDDPGFIPERPEFAAMRAETAPVVVGKDAQGRKTFKSKLRTGSFYLVFYAVPSANADHFAFYVDVPDPYANKTCDLGFLTDGELVPSSSFNVKTPTGKRIKVVFQSEVLDSFTQSRFVSGRVCDLEWRLQPAQLKILAEFSARYKEEVAWLAKNEAKNNVSTQ